MPYINGALAEIVESHRATVTCMCWWGLWGGLKFGRSTTSSGDMENGRASRRWSLRQSNKNQLSNKMEFTQRRMERTKKKGNKWNKQAKRRWGPNKRWKNWKQSQPGDDFICVTTDTKSQSNLDLMTKDSSWSGRWRVSAVLWTALHSGNWQAYYVTHVSLSQHEASSSIENCSQRGKVLIFSCKTATYEQNL